MRRRAMVLGLVKNGKTQAEVMRELGISQSMASKDMMTLREEGKVEPPMHPRKKYPKKKPAPAPKIARADETSPVLGLLRAKLAQKEQEAEAIRAVILLLERP